MIVSVHASYRALGLLTFRDDDPEETRFTLGVIRDQARTDGRLTEGESVGLVSFFDAMISIVGKQYGIRSRSAETGDGCGA